MKNEIDPHYTDVEQLQIYAKEQNLGIEAWYIARKTDMGRQMDTMTITDEKDWNIYLTRSVMDVVNTLEKQKVKDPFETVCNLIDYEKQGVISKGTIVNLFSEVLGL